MRWWYHRFVQPNDRWERNCEIVALRDRGLTLRELGERYGLCHRRIDQIVAITKRKQRHSTAQSYWGA